MDSENNNQVSLFQIPQNQKLLSNVCNKLEPLARGDDITHQKARYLIDLFSAIHQNPAEWDSQCQVNINFIGSSFFNFLDTLLNTEVPDSDLLDKIFASGLRFTLELDLSRYQSLPHPLTEFVHFAIEHKSYFSESAQNQIDYAFKAMPISILKQLTNTGFSSGIKNLNDSLDTIREREGYWKKELEERTKEAKSLADTLDKYTTAFNFVGLYNGFDNLSKTKNNEKNLLLTLLFILGIGALCFIFYELIWIYNNISVASGIQLEKLDAEKSRLVGNAYALAYFLVPSITFIALIIYFFRVTLHNYVSVKSQLLQIELRKTLCQFIQHYAEYSKKLKTEDQVSLEKFENIIFSGIITDGNALPSSYDGVEQISKLVKNLRN